MWYDDILVPGVNEIRTSCLVHVYHEVPRDKVDLTAKCHDSLKLRVANTSEEDGVLWIRETVEEIRIHMFRGVEGRR
jgi:hypothetical protein